MRKPDGYAVCSTSHTMKTLALALALATGCAGTQHGFSSRHQMDDDLLLIGLGTLAVVAAVAMVVGPGAASSSEPAPMPAPLPQPPPRP